MSGAEEVMDEEYEERMLTYPGRVQETVGKMLGPGLDGRFWRMIGGMYDTELDKTFITFKCMTANRA